MTTETPTADKRFDSLEVGIYGTAHLTHDTYQAFLPPLLPLLIEKFSLLKADAGLLSVFLQFPSVVQPFVGYFADRANLRYPVMLAPALTATTMSLLANVPVYWMLVVLLLVSGFSSAAFHAVGPVLAGRQSGSRMGLGMSIWMVGGELGRALGPVVVAGGLTLMGVGGMPWLMLGGWATTALLWWRFRKAPMRASGNSTDLDWRLALRRTMPLLLPVAGIQVARSFLVGSMAVFLPVFMTEAGAGLWEASAALSVLQAAAVAGAMLGGWLSDRLGRRMIILISLTTSPLFLFLFLTGGWRQMPALAGMGITLFGSLPVLMATVLEGAPENRALANGIFMVFNFSIQALATFLVGVMGDAWGLRLTYQVSALLSFAGLPFLLFIPRKRR
jgi:FSR family fosmidomycin resistance protein-like MFS transporter